VFGTSRFHKALTRSIDIPSTPEFFNVSTVRMNAADNAPIRVSNVRKLADTIQDYYEQVLRADPFEQI
jgi:hypothetical protein